MEGDVSRYRKGEVIRNTTKSGRHDTPKEFICKLVWMTGQQEQTQKQIRDVVDARGSKHVCTFAVCGLAKVSIREPTPAIRCFILQKQES